MRLRRAHAVSAAVQVEHDPIGRRNATAALRHHFAWDAADARDTAETRSAVVDAARPQSQAQDAFEQDALLRDRSTGPKRWQQQRAQHAPQHGSDQSLPDRLGYSLLRSGRRARQ